MTIEQQLAAGVALDLILGDPSWSPHPVKFIARIASALESLTRKDISNERAAGILTALLVIFSSGGVAYLILLGAGSVSVIAADIAGIVLIYFSLAIKDLIRHSRDVLKALDAGDIALARKRVAMIVGRDTENLDEEGIVRAVVESVAENLTDGIVAPLFYAALFGPVFAITYKAVNTLDSMFGYKNEKYIRFGWASARIDDVANIIPARFAALCVVTAAYILRYRPLDSLKILFRDGHNHPSPNSGLTEAAVAGALGVELGGLSYYGGKPLEKQKIGAPFDKLNILHIKRVNRLILAATAIAAAVLIVSRVIFHHIN